LLDSLVGVAFFKNLFKNLPPIKKYLWKLYEIPVEKPLSFAYAPCRG
jgi:hypothetical protein